MSGRMIRMSAAALGLALFAGVSGTAAAGSLENLERERALFIEMVLDPALGAGERSERISQAEHRLVDLERMTLRDPRMRGKNTPIVRRAFERYDLTFLVHASVERDRSVVAHWLDEMGMSTDALMAAREGRR